MLSIVWYVASYIAITNWIATCFATFQYNPYVQNIFYYNTKASKLNIILKGVARDWSLLQKVQRQEAVL